MGEREPVLPKLTPAIEGLPADPYDLLSPEARAALLADLVEIARIRRTVELPNHRLGGL